MENNPEQHFPEEEIVQPMSIRVPEVPSETFLWAAFASITTALFLQCLGKKHTGLFVGQLAAPLLLMGIYKKLNKPASNEISGEEESYLSY
ncbi:hypothetical protein [Chitinophaga sp. Cy-1792]|uniref:hypothetical protein n=1 Tax=Chitinophaga sp. Cy-1792 TaxID=2608339 RepID=UPI0014242AFC|nr:hypothetical protein [Chitinophaga sp. Cy-1792]NIG55630.1 hypothetical protein [Chitinophaga sp. Cy-1792]